MNDTLLLDYFHQGKKHRKKTKTMCKFAQKYNFFLKHDFLQKLNDLENLIFFFMVTKKNEMFKIVQFLKKIVFQKKVEILGNFGKSLSFFRGLLSSSAWTLRPIPCVAVQGRCRPDAEACDCESVRLRKTAPPKAGAWRSQAPA